MCLLRYVFASLRVCESNFIVCFDLVTSANQILLIPQCTFHIFIVLTKIAILSKIAQTI